MGRSRRQSKKSHQGSTQQSQYTKFVADFGSAPMKLAHGLFTQDVCNCVKQDSLSHRVHNADVCP